MAKYLIIGMTVAVDQAYSGRAPEPAVDQRLKDADKIRDDIAKKRAAQRELLVDLPVFGKPTEMAVLDSTGHVLRTFQLKRDADTIDAVKLLNGHNNGDDMVVAYGLNIRDRMRQLAAAAGRANFPLSPAFWHTSHLAAPPGIAIDPYEYVIKKEQQPHVTFPLLCEYLGVDLPSVEVLNSDALVQANLTFALVQRLGFMFD